MRLIDADKYNQGIDCCEKWLESEAPDRCPFCGGKAELNIIRGFNEEIVSVSVICADCATSTQAYLTKKGAIQAWNRRFSLPSYGALYKRLRKYKDLEKQAEFLQRHRKTNNESLSEYQKAQKWLKSYDWDDEPEADDNLATICYALQEVEKYKDLKEQGKLLKLPCAVGDTIYTLNTLPSGRVVIGEMVADAFLCALGMLEGRFGKTVFLTKSEAEAVLKELREIYDMKDKDF